MWYTNSYRRNLVDMHIDDWDSEFMSQFDPEAYYQNMVAGKMQTPMIYLQSHAGHCYFPTKSGHLHAAFVGREDRVRQLIDLCRAGGMSVVGYYSLIFNAYEHDRHPEWKIHDGSGLSERDRGGRCGYLCPNNREHRAFIIRQMGEIAAYFTLDGMFYDQLFWPDICRCEACQRRFAKEVGGEIPTEENWADPRWLAFVRKRSEWMGEFAQFVKTESNRIMPDVTVEMNCASCVNGDWHNAASELVNDACDYTGGDLYGDLYNHSFTCKYYMNITRNMPFEYMTCRCDADLVQHTVTKPERVLESAIMLTCAHHGASLIIDAIDPRGTMDRRVYERIGRIFDRQIPYEPYLKGEHIADVGVYYASISRYNRDGQEITNKDGCVNTVRTLVENHVPVSVLSAGCLDKIGGQKFIFAPCPVDLDDAVSDRLIQYARDGGTLYFSGVGTPKLLRELLGATYTGEMTRETFTYLSPTDLCPTLFGEFTPAFPMPFLYKLPIVTAPDDGVAARITLPYTARAEKKFASFWSDPPGKPTRHPGFIIKPYEKGTVIWSAAPITQDGRFAYKKFVMDLLWRFVDPQDLFLRTDAVKTTELNCFRTEEGFLLHASNLLPGEDPAPVRAFGVSVKTGVPARSVTLLPDGAPVPFENRGGAVHFTVNDFTVHAMVRIDV